MEQPPEDRSSASTNGADEDGRLGPQLVEASPERGFHYPYFIHAPPAAHCGPSQPLLVEPASVAQPTDDFEEQVALAGRRAEGGTGRRIADELGVPFLTPVFPRPVSEPVDWRHYVHSLDVETLAIDDGPLERVDRQLLRMVDDARSRLAERDVSVSEEFALNGFSASGTFATRFATIHPERVLSVSAGGLNGMVPLPRETIDGRTLPYPIGVGDLEAVVGDPFDPEAFCDVHQFLYLGAVDDNDTIPYPDAWTDGELARTALDVYGCDIHEERFPYCKAVYEGVDAPAIFKRYPGAGHEPIPAEADIVEFHRRCIAGEDVESIRRAVGENVEGRAAPSCSVRSRRSILGKRSLITAATRLYFGFRRVR